MTNVIAISGWARAGKDTIADYLVENYGYRKISFADPMREALYRLNPLVRDIGGMVWSLRQVIDLAGWEGAKNITPDVRTLMQRFGTEVGRELFGYDFWVDLAFSKIDSNEKIVFADCRFQNEANATLAFGGEVWRVERTGYGPANEHNSERDLDNYNFSVVFSNSSDIQNLQNEVEKYIAKNKEENVTGS
jgi:hypothetical protein